MDYLCNNIFNSVGFKEHLKASPREISLALIKIAKDLFKEIMPASREVSITSGNSWILFSRIKLAVAEFCIIISQAGIMPPLIRGISLWETMPKSEIDNCARTCDCCSEGKVSTIR